MMGVPVLVSGAIVIAVVFMSDCRRHCTRDEYDDRNLQHQTTHDTPPTLQFGPVFVAQNRETAWTSLGFG
jgi:hypothetical protein